MSAEGWISILVVIFITILISLIFHNMVPSKIQGNKKEQISKSDETSITEIDHSAFDGGCCAEIEENS